MLDAKKKTKIGHIVKKNKIWRRLYSQELHEKFHDIPVVQYIQVTECDELDICEEYQMTEYQKGY